MLTLTKPRLQKFIKWLTPLFFIAAAYCKNPPAAEEKKVPKDSVSNAVEEMAEAVNGKFSDQSALKFDSLAIPGFFSAYPQLAPYKKDVEQFYKNRNYSFAWYDTSGLIEQAGNFYSRLRNLSAEGINNPVPYLNNLDSLMGGTNAGDKKQNAETEVLFSSLYFYFANKVWGGLDNNSTTKLEWYVPKKKVSYEAWLDSTLKSGGSFNHDNEPVYRQYNLLKTFLEKYRAMEKSGPWTTITADKKSYRLQDSAKAIVSIKAKLAQLGDLQTPDSSNLFDSTLQKAVKSFQHRYGLTEDGIVGQAMIKELNTPLHTKIEKILLNMERSRWLPMSVSGEYFAVNIPEFKLHAYNSDSLLWSMNVVVGQSANKTVVFAGKLKYVVFSPYWNVPPGIYKNEVLPGMKKNKNYLAQHHMEISGNGVRQIPGPWNSLGQVKFLFPNSYSIYFHDTPAKSLFGESKRDFSHGCIRLSEPKKMAAYLLRNDTTWTDKKITAAMNAGKEKYVTLGNEVPVFITYFTAWVDRSGKLNLRDDIYKRDQRLAEMIMTNQ